MRPQIIGMRVTRRQYIRQLLKSGKSKQEVVRRLTMIRQMRIPFFPEDPAARKAYLTYIRRKRAKLDALYSHAKGQPTSHF